MEKKKGWGGREKRKEAKERRRELEGSDEWKGWERRLGRERRMEKGRDRIDEEHERGVGSKGSKEGG